MDIFSLLSLGLINGEITTNDIIKDKSYKRFIISANKQINKYGRGVEYHTVTNTSDTSKPWTTASSNDTSSSVKIVFTTTEDNGKETLLANDGIRSRSVVIGYMAYSGKTPTILDYILDGGKVYKIVNVQTVKPGALPILFILE